MHVSLSRRSHRFGLSLQCLLWICFGLLAVVPWRHIRGQEDSASSGVAQQITDPGERSPAEQSDPPQVETGSGAIVWDKLTIPPAVLDPAQRTTGLSSIAPLTLPVKAAARNANSSSSLIFRSQTPPPDPTLAYPNPAYEMGPTAGPPTDDDGGGMGMFSDDRLTGRSGKAYGAQVRTSIITGPAIGREHPILPIELMPYAFLDNNLFFADVRGFTDMSNGWGGNFGGGYRRYLPMFDRILGVNAYYDYDNTSGVLFREIGFGAESLGALYDIRANAYLPTGVSSQTLGISNINGTQVFEAHIMKVDQLKQLANALHGFDSEIGFPLPGRISKRHDVRVFGGGYWFEGPNVSSFGGWKARIQANVVPSVAINLQVSDDAQFHTNVVFGASWTFGGYRQPDEQRKTQYSRMTTPVQRQYNMVVGLTSTTLKGVTVVDPSTGTPYFFEHVSSSATTPVIGGVIGDGTVEHPFQNLLDAQNAMATRGSGIAGDDIIFVHANSTYGVTDAGVQVALQQNVRVLGESANVEHQVQTSGGLLNLPHPTQTGGVPSGAKPIFTNSPGNGVVLANNSEFSGFQIGTSTSGPAGIGIVGTGISNALVRQTDVNSTVGEAVSLTGITGTVKFLGDTINDPTTNATTFHIQNTASTGNIIFSSDPLSDLVNPTTGATINTPGNINNVSGIGGRALLIEGGLAGSIVNFTGSTTNDTQGLGILVRNNAGTVSLGDLNVTNSLGVGLDIIDNSGTIQGNGTFDIAGSLGDSIRIENLASTGLVVFSDPGTSGTGTAAAGINISNRKSRGIDLNNNAGAVLFQTPVNITAQSNSLTQAAVEYQGSSGNVTFGFVGTTAKSLNISGGGPGVLIGTRALDGLGNAIDSTGRFLVSGDTAITNIGGIGVDIIDDKSTVIFNGTSGTTRTLDITQRGDIGIQVLGSNGSVTFNGVTTINNENSVTLPGVDIRGNQDITGGVTFNQLTVVNPVGPNPLPEFAGSGVNIGGTGTDVNPQNVTINSLQITGATSGTGGVYNAFYANNVGQTAALDSTGNALITGLRILAATAVNSPNLTTISATGGVAVNILNSVMDVSLNQVSSTDSPTSGIILTNNQSFRLLTNPAFNDFMFSITGQPGTGIRNGGTITGATDTGIVISQTGSYALTNAVSLNQVSVDTNRNQGINASGLLQLAVSNSDISSNTHTGIFAQNIPRIDIVTSNFSQNGTLASDNAIHLRATQTLPFNQLLQGEYIWNVSNNAASGGLAGGFIGGTTAGDLVVVDSNSTTLQVQTSPTLTQATPLVFTFSNNSLLVQAGIAARQVAGVAVNWKGFETGSINANTVNLSGFNTAFQISNANTQYLTGFNILGNTVTASNGGNIGIDVNNFGPTDLSIGTLLSNGVNTQQTFTFSTPSTTTAANFDTGMRFSVLNSTTVNSDISLTDNIITMTGQNTDRGILFSTLQAPATITLSNNTININSLPSGSFPGQGIAFQSVLGTILLQGNLSNSVTINNTNSVPNLAGVTTADWVLLSGNRSGRFFVNGLTVQ